MSTWRFSEPEPAPRASLTPKVADTELENDGSCCLPDGECCGKITSRIHGFNTLPVAVRQAILQWYSVNYPGRTPVQLIVDDVDKNAPPGPCPHCGDTGDF